MSRSRLIVPVVFWLALVGALIALWLSGQAAGTWDHVRSAHRLPLLAVIACGIALPLVHAVRWCVLMDALDAEVPIGLAADVTVSSSLVNYAGPGFLGAPAKAFLANRAAGAPYGKTILSMAFEQGLDFLVLLVGSVCALLVIGPQPFMDAFAGYGHTARIALIVGAIALIAIVVLIGRERMRRGVSRIREAFAAIGSRIDRPAVAWCTATLWLLQAAVIASLLWALGMSLSLTAVLSLSTIPLLLGQVVPLPGGLGVREAAMVALAVSVGMSSGELLGFAILQRVLLVVALPVALLAVRIARRIGVVA